MANEELYTQYRKSKTRMKNNNNCNKKMRNNNIIITQEKKANGEMMEAARTSETSVDIELRTWQYIPKDSELHTPLGYVRFQVLMAGSIKMTVSWVTAPSNVVEIDQCFRGVYCVHHQGSPLKC
jgi:hypothetical protein